MLGVLDVLKRVFDPNERELKKLQKFVELVNEQEEEISKLTDEQLMQTTTDFKDKLNQGTALDDILPAAFAVVRETARRKLGMRHYDVQIIGGVVLHQGRVAEMKTGEGKTLMATLPVYLNALLGRGVHVVTVNDYLAKRDARWMGPIYNFLGLSVGVIQHDVAFLYDPDHIVGDEGMDQLRLVSRREAYGADITYGTNNEFGFDYLRDNMVMDLREKVQRDLYFAIVDEVDSILIDEARTPLIISGRGQRSSDNYQKFARLVKRLKIEEDYTVDEKAHSVPLTEKGIETVEGYLNLKSGTKEEENKEKPEIPENVEELGIDSADLEEMKEIEEKHQNEEVHPLYDRENIELLHYLETALKAKELYKRDVDYVIKDGEIIIVDEFTGRLMHGRRYSDGIHQAIEAKENVKVRSEDQTLASITFQNYFRMYEKLSGMTGTAATEEKEFRQIYNVDVVIIPTNKPCIRNDQSDRIYKTEKTKYEAVVNEILELNEMGRPVLVGTRSIEISELLSTMLKRKGVAHNVLNAKHHEKEAHIIAQAGKPAAVTIATNMAGRGVDIILGGTPPSAEKEELIYKSSKAHLSKIGSEIVELEEKLGRKKTEKEGLENKQNGLQKEIHEVKKQLKSLETEELKMKLEQLRTENDKLENDIKLLGIEAQDLEKAVKGHREMLPGLEDKADKAKEKYEEKRKQVEKEYKEWTAASEEVKKNGGLGIIGTERHESRRIDNQLRGRAGRQGDNGSSRFYVSLEDELMRLFGTDRLPDWLTSWEEDVNTPLEFGIFTRSIQKAQEKVESHHFDIRKSVLDYDNVMNEQRKIIYHERDRILRGENIKDEYLSFIDNYIDKLIYLYTYDPPLNLLNQVNGNWNIAYLFFKDNFAEKHFEEWEFEEIFGEIKEMFFPLPFDAKSADLVTERRNELWNKIREWAIHAYSHREEKLGQDLMRILERWLLLQMIDSKWMDHLQVMDDLREGISLRAYGQRDPLAEYIRESFELYKELRQSIEEDALKNIFRIQVKSEGIKERYERKYQVTREHRGEGQGSGEGSGGTTIRTGPKIGRNDPCPCGSGKKYKKCCGRNK